MEDMQAMEEMIIENNLSILNKFDPKGDLLIKVLQRELDSLGIKIDLNELEKSQGKQRIMLFREILNKIADKTEDVWTTEWIYKLIKEEKEKKNIRVKVKPLNFYFKVDDYWENMKRLYDHNPFFYDKSKIYWIWNYYENKYEIVDETDVLVFIENLLNFQGHTISKGTMFNYLEAFKRIGRMQIPEPAKEHWVQFKDKAFSVTSKNIYDVEPNYFFTNPIPWEIGVMDTTPIMDKLFVDWVGEENKQLLYEILAYCCYSSYPIHLIFCLVGSGRNGKSQFLKILDKFLGVDNTVSTELDTIINNRFETFKLYRKLACVMGETNFGTLSKTSIIKKLTGGDKVGFEMKNKMPFDDYNYAKMLIASNSLPTTQDTSEGFFRRWLIIDFANEFEDIGREVWKDVPEREYRNLARKVINILPGLLEKGKFTSQGSIQERKIKYIEHSNPIKIFIEENCKIGFENYAKYNEMYTKYVNWLTANKKRRVKLREFKTALEDEGFYVEKTAKKEIGENGYEEWIHGYYIIGLKLK